jgi:CRP-like cAMP-binding protein
MTTSTPPSALPDPTLDPRHLTRLKALLAQTRYFAGLPSEIQERIAVSAIPRHFRAGQVIYLEGEPAEYVYILEHGWVKATRMSHQGREQALSFLHPVEIFGDVAAFTGTSYPATVTALEAVELWAIPSRHLLEQVKQSPELALAVIQKLGGRVLHYIELVEDLSLRSVEARLANTLLQHARSVDGKLIVPRRSWATFDEMSVRLGTVRDVLSRALKTLESEGLLKVEKQAILILDAGQLEKRGRM